MFLIFLDNLKRLSIFIIISKTILHFGIGKKFEKYLKLILSFMIVAQLVFALGSFFQQDKGFLAGLSKENYYEQWEKYMGELETEYEEGQRMLESRIEYGNLEEEQKEERKGIIIEKVVIP